MGPIDLQIAARLFSGLKRQLKRALSRVKGRKCVLQGLNRLRKRACFQTSFPKNIPQRLKSSFIFSYLRHATRTLKSAAVMP